MKGLTKIYGSSRTDNRTGGIKPDDNAAFGAQPQGCGRLFDRRLIAPDWRKCRPASHPTCLTTLAVWQYRGRSSAGRKHPGHANVARTAVTSPRSWGLRRL